MSIRAFAVDGKLASRSAPKAPKPPRRIGRKLAIISGVALSAYAVDEYYYALLWQRSCRAIYVLLWIAYQYGQNTASYDSMEDLHEIASEKLFSMLAANKGLYIKQGQAIANQGSVFPAAYQRRFAKLYDGAPEDPWSDVDKLIRTQLGNNYETELFDYVDHKPIASALIAQVHRGRLKKEQKDVAIKVQHPYIQKQIGVDLAIYRLVSRAYLYFFDLPLSFFTQYVSDQLVREVDFTIEAANGDKLSRLIKADKGLNVDVYVPVNYEDYSGKRVLVSEWIDGVSLTDKQRLIDAGFDITKTMKQYITVFGRQMFEYGFIHSDPHPGNMLARFRGGKQELVILDHGLYILLPAKFREEYCQIWKCMFDFDQKEIAKIAESWGVGSTGLLTAMVQLRPPKDASLKDSRNSYELIKTFLGDETKFPLPMLFMLRTMRMMQNLNQTMGSPVNRVNMLTESAVHLLLEFQQARGRHFREWILLARIQVTLFFSNFVFLLFRLRQIVLGERYSRGEGIEDYIDKYMKQTAKSMGIEIIDEEV